VLLVFLPSLDFIISFVACLRAGLIAVPVYPPDPRRVRAYISAFSQTARSCNARVAISHAAYLSSVSLANLRDTALKYLSFGRAKESGSSSISDAWPEITWIDATIALKETRGTTAAAADIDNAPSDALAFLQYTSGSTSDPKGVMISHGNLAHNLQTIVQSLDAGTDTVVTSWLPQYHDMGLIGM
jgi:acyl-CoA synthetase (AMP-forming)/AMP-acid ligase II